MASLSKAQSRQKGNLTKSNSLARQVNRTFACLVFIGLALLAGPGCTASRTALVDIKNPVPADGIIFVVDGAGKFQGCSNHLREVIDADHLPLQVATVEWSHGYGRIIADQIDYAYTRAKGYELAQRMHRFRIEHPGVPILLVGHSAGCAVALAALENLPPDSVQRAVLLSPSLSTTYDVRPGLRAVMHGLHVFYSSRDTLYLGAWTGIFGNSDRHWGPSSGRFGFQVLCADPEDATLYGKLFQRAWQTADRSTGNDGKHYGDYQLGFVRAQILPLLLNKPL